MTPHYKIDYVAVSLLSSNNKTAFIKVNAFKHKKQMKMQNKPWYHWLTLNNPLLSLSEKYKWYIVRMQVFIAIIPCS